MRNCGVCTSEKRPLVDDALLRRISCQKIAHKTGFSMDQVWRHKQHMERPPVVVIDQSSASMPLMDRVERIIGKLEGIAGAATNEKEWAAATSALSELRRCLELLGKLGGQLQPGSPQIRVGVAVNVNTSRSTSELNDFELQERVAQEVSEATSGFNPAVIARLQRLAEGSAMPKELSVYAAESEDNG